MEVSKTTILKHSLTPVSVHSNDMERSRPCTLCRGGFAFMVDKIYVSGNLGVVLSFFGPCCILFWNWVSSGRIEFSSTCPNFGAQGLNPGYLYGLVGRLKSPSLALAHFLSLVATLSLEHQREGLHTASCGLEVFFLYNIY